MTRDLTKWLAFTLAEVLITLAIIGVVAVLTIPALLSNTNEKGLNTADSVFQEGLGEALKIMNLQGTLADHETTQEFVDELSRHMKVIKTCPSTELSNCFVSEFQSGDKTIKTTDLKASKNLYSTTDYGTETIGVVFGNGIRALIAYNPNTTQDQFDESSETVLPVVLEAKTSDTGRKDMVSLKTDSLSILYILQEKKNNNVYSATGNIRGINVTFGISKCADGATKYGGKCYIFRSPAMTWANAKTFCSEKGMSLISQENGYNGGTLSTLMKDSAFKTALNIPSGCGWVWSDSSTYNSAYIVHASYGSVSINIKNDYYSVLCSGN